MAFSFLGSAVSRRSVLFTDRDYARQRAYFAAHPELEPTPLRALPALARQLGLAAVTLKDETARFGLNAFKAAGAMFAVDALRDEGTVRARDTLVCASEGNHGRAVARAARAAGCHARVYMAASAAESRVTAIEGEGATVVHVDGTYDDALRMMAREAGIHGWRVVSDTALEDEPVDVPRLIMLGYTRLMDEAEAQWKTDGRPDVVFVPGGVGGLLGAVADWVGGRPAAERPLVVCVEPVSAACLQASARAGRPQPLPGPFDTAMAGLRCGEVSRASFDAVLAGVAAYVAIEDAWAFAAMRSLARGTKGDPAILAGASGAAALGGLLATMRDPALAEIRAGLGLGPAARVLAIVSEGVTDPELFAGVVRRPINEHPTAAQMEP